MKPSSRWTLSAVRTADGDPTTIPTMTLLTANFYKTATTLTVDAAAAAAFPQTGPFTIIVGTEHMLVTAGWGTTTWTVTRGTDGTTAYNHAKGTAIILSTTLAAAVTAAAHHDHGRCGDCRHVPEHRPVHDCHRQRAHAGHRRASAPRRGPLPEAQTARRPRRTRPGVRSACWRRHCPTEPIPDGAGPGYRQVQRIDRRGGQSAE